MSFVVTCHLSPVFESTFAFDFCFPCLVSITFYVILSNGKCFPNIEFFKSIINENNMTMFCLLLFIYQEFILGAIKEVFFFFS